MKKILNKDEITGIDLELSNICNLKCPICLSQLEKTKDKFKPKNINVDFLIEQLESFKNLTLVSIAGDASEPTLYPDLIKLLDYLKNKPNIYTELYTNASVHDEAWWEELNKHFSAKSIVYFTICGSTQELHSKYRVGSDLDKIIKNALAFKKNNPFNNDHMQYIKFEYNKNDIYERIMKILTQFSTYGFIDTDPVYERFYLDSKLNNDGICSEKMFSFFYKKQLKEVLKKEQKDITCYSYNKKYIRMDNNGIISPCVCYRLFNDKNFLQNNQLDYTDIYNNKFDFCFECDKDMVKFLNSNSRDAFYMC